MPVSYVVALLVVAVLAGVAAVALPFLRGRSRPGPADGVLALVGWLGLALHCGAMFARPFVAWIPGSAGYVDVVNGMGAGSIVLYLVPAALLLVGLRRARPPVLAVCAVMLGAVGITMYDGGTLQAHLTAIFGAVVIGTLASAGLVARVVRGRRKAFGNAPEPLA